MKIDQNELLADPLIDGKKFERAIRKLSLFEGKPGEIGVEFKQDEDGAKHIFITAQSEVL